MVKTTGAADAFACRDKRGVAQARDDRHFQASPLGLQVTCKSDLGYRGSANGEGLSGEEFG